MFPHRLLPVPKPTDPLPYTDLELLTAIILGFNESDGEIVISPRHICRLLGTESYPVRVKQFEAALKSLTEDTALNEARQPGIRFSSIAPSIQKAGYAGKGYHRIHVTSISDTFASRKPADFVPPSSWTKSRIGTYYALLSRDEFERLKDSWLKRNEKYTTHLSNLALMVRAYLLIKSELPYKWYQRNTKATDSIHADVHASKNYKLYMGQIEQEYILKELRVTKPTWQKALTLLADSRMLFYQPGIKGKGCGCFLVGDTTSEENQEIWQAFCVIKGLWYE